MRPSRADQLLGRRAERRRDLAEQHLLHLPRGGARGRRDRGGGAAAVAMAARRENRCRRCARVMSSGRRPNSSATTCASTVPMPVPRSCTPDSTSHRAVAQQAHFAGGVGLHIGAPQRLRHADAALDQPGIGAGRVAPLPADALRAEAAFLAPHRARVDAVAQRQRIDAELVGEFVDRLLHGERAGRVAGPAHRRAAAGVDEHVVLRGGEIRAGVERLGEIADAGADADAGRAVFHQRDRGQRAVTARADAQVLPGRRTVAGVEMLFLAIEHQAHRRARLARQHDGVAAIGAELRLRAEAAAHGGDLHAHLAELQAEGLAPVRGARRR